MKHFGRLYKDDPVLEAAFIKLFGGLLLLAVLYIIWMMR